MAQCGAHAYELPVVLVAWPKHPTVCLTFHEGEDDGFIQNPRSPLYLTVPHQISLMQNLTKELGGGLVKGDIGRHGAQNGAQQL